MQSSRDRNCRPLQNFLQVVRKNIMQTKAPTYPCIETFEIFLLCRCTYCILVRKNIKLDYICVYVCVCMYAYTCQTHWFSTNNQKHDEHAYSSPDRRTVWETSSNMQSKLLQTAFLYMDLRISSNPKSCCERRHFDTAVHPTKKPAQGMHTLSVCESDAQQTQIAGQPALQRAENARDARDVRMLNFPTKKQ